MVESYLMSELLQTKNEIFEIVIGSFDESFTHHIKISDISFSIKKYKIA